jgi:hypothetical protein
MKKVLLIVVASAALIALVPATALAKHGDRRHHHRGHHDARVHHRMFGHDEGNQGNDNQPAGKIVSFTNGVLTIMTNDGNTASGKVTNATELKCEQQEPAEMQNHDRGRGGDSGGDNDRGDNNDRGGDNDRGDDQGDNDNDNDEANEMCTTADLTPGAVVQDAELRISSAGAVWDEVELVSQSSQSSNS